VDASLASLQGIVQHATMLLLLVYRVGRRMPIADQQNVLDYPALHWATASIENDARNSEGVGAGKMNRDVAGRVQYRRGAARRDHDHFHSLPSFNP